MNDIERKRVEKALASFMAKRRPPVHLRDELDLNFRFDGRILVIFEVRPRWDNPREKVEEAIAKGRYVKSRDEWLVYWQRADLKWHKYPPAPAVDSIEAFLELVDRDEHACFFG